MCIRDSLNERRRKSFKLVADGTDRETSRLLLVTALVAGASVAAHATALLRRFETVSMKGDESLSSLWQMGRTEKHLDFCWSLLWSPVLLWLRMPLRSCVASS